MMSISFITTETTNAPIVALHSSASNGGQWGQLAKDLAGRFSLHAFDLPGYGLDPLEPDMSQTGAAISAAPVLREIEALGRPVHLVGHSNGGGIAINIALLRPDLVKSLTLYEPAIFHFLAQGNDLSQVLFRDIQHVSATVSTAVSTGDPASAMQHFLNFWNEDGFWEALPEQAKDRLAAMVPSVLRDFENGFAEDWDLSELSRLEMPTLVMTGLESPQIAQHAAVEIAQALPNARMALLPELGHMAPIFQPEWVNSRIIEHVASAERPAVNISWPSGKAA